MRILTAIGKYYYGDRRAIEPTFIYFTDPLRDLGHEVETFDQFETSRIAGADKCGEEFLEAVRRGRYDMVLYMNPGKDLVPRTFIRKATEYCPIIAWNTDDNWQWESYGRDLCEYFSFMVTTYPHVFEENREKHPNLRLSQWGCYEKFGDFDRPKDLDFTFVGSAYEHRNWECRYLQRRAGLRTYGAGARLVRLRLPYRPPFPDIPWLRGRAVDFAVMNSIWNRTKVSYTPLGASINPQLLQIKGRVFEMGLSGTLMLCDESGDLERYYTPGKEFVPFRNLDDCVRLADYYLENETERERIAKAYHDRTRTEHLWRHRFTRLFRDIGLT